MNVKTLTKRYDKLTDRERAALAINAYGRKDEREARRLIDTAPRVTLDAPDCGRMMLRLANVIEWHTLKQTESAALLFMQLHYLSADTDLDFASNVTLTGYEIIARADGWEMFCGEIGLDPQGAFRIITANTVMLEFAESIARKAEPKLEDARAALRKHSKQGNAEPKTAEIYATEYRELLNCVAGERI